MTPTENLYSTVFQKNLFNEMSQTYGLVNLIASFGFTSIWRRYCVRSITPRENVVVVDLMTGMGELFHNINDYFNSVDKVLAIDFSHEMCEQARRNSQRFSRLSCDVMEVDALNSPLESESVDIVFCSFGLKTLSADQQKILAKEVSRILKPGGQFSFIEISVPTNFWLKLPFLFYLRYFIPFIGRLFLGNPANYRMLARYTEAFQNARFFQSCLHEEKLVASELSHFFGCATGVFGSKSRSA